VLGERLQRLCRREDVVSHQVDGHLGGRRHGDVRGLVRLQVGQGAVCFLRIGLFSRESAFAERLGSVGRARYVGGLLRLDCM
jgi:hypothetical protein